MDLVIDPLPSSRLTSKKKVLVDSSGFKDLVTNPSAKLRHEELMYVCVCVCFSSARASKMKNPSSMLNQDVNILYIFQRGCKACPPKGYAG